ncbi:MAG TPA: CoA ester lyase, partial [Beijerinckiaceae bacterium]
GLTAFPTAYCLLPTAYCLLPYSPLAIRYSPHMTSYLFTPASSPRKIARALASEADWVILDLEDSVTAADKDMARMAAAEALRLRPAGGPRIMVRVNALDSGLVDADLDAVAPAAPDAIMLPKAMGGDDAQQLSVKLAVREAEAGLEDGAIGVVPLCAESSASLFRMGGYRGATGRLVGLAWGAEDLAADIGARVTRLPSGDFTPPFALARSLTLHAAAAAGVPAIDAVYPNFRDAAGLRAECAAARRDGFAGKLAIHPDQAAIIREAMAPSDAEIARARAIEAAFAAAPGAGALALDGGMIDAAHLRWARRILAQAAPRG